MKRNKGISMISLVIIIVVTVILIGIATTAGYRYIVESNKIQAEAVTRLVAEAAYRRQNDLTAGVAVMYYEGYSFDVEKNASTKYKEITGLPEEDENANSIPDCLEEVGAKWFLFDAESANQLGVVESDRFITRNISYIPAITEKEVTLVLADYTTGDGYLINMPKDIISDSIRQEGGCLNSPTGNHDYKIMATCTKPAQCIYCGQADPLNPALGHDFTPPTCTASGICRRCGAVDPEHGPLGHLMISNAEITDLELIAQMTARDCLMYANDEGDVDSSSTAAWITDALKHWHECIRCGEKSDEREHNKGFVDIDDTYHYEKCSICGWESIKSKHVFTYINLPNETYAPGDHTHLKKCTICGYQEEHSDSGWVDTHPDYHYRNCNDSDPCHDSTVIISGTETEVLFKEAHYDNDHDLYCDICGRSLDKEPPHGFGTDEKYYGKVISTTTSQIIVEAFTEDDGVGVDFYQFGILNPDTGVIDWQEPIQPTSPTSAVQQTFDNLKSDTEYVIYVKATDKSGNTTVPYRIPDTITDDFPSFNGLTNIPDDYVRGPILAGIAPIDTDLTNIDLNYSLDDGKTWTKIPIENVPTATITLTKEHEEVKIKFTDDAGNESGIWEYVIERIDTTPPVVTIETADDKNEELAMSHNAIVTIYDEKSGIAPNTEVRYAWSTSNTEVPTEFETIETQNLENASRVSFNISTPPNVMGQYYLWILEGVEDRVGNPTTEPVCSGMYFNVDDVEVEVTNIKMLDMIPAVNNEYLFVRTDGTVTISFETDKKLGADAVVTLNGNPVEMNSSNNGLEHVGTIKITYVEFAEGVLQVRISNIVSETGKVSNRVYTNDDLTEGPVIYDRTLPVFEYISKAGTLITP